MRTVREKLATEDSVENHLMRGVAKKRGLTIKLRFLRGWPDRLVLLPKGVLFFVELKRPVGGVFEPLQQYIHKKLRKLGFQVWVCHTKEQVNEILARYP